MLQVHPEPTPGWEALAELRAQGKKLGGPRRVSEALARKAAEYIVGGYALEDALSH